MSAQHDATAAKAWTSRLYETENEFAQMLNMLMEGRLLTSDWQYAHIRIGDLGPVGAREAHRRLGLTRAVLLECLRRMRERGMDRACVSTTVTNWAARPLYESVGFQIVNQYLDYTQAEPGR